MFDVMYSCSMSIYHFGSSVLSPSRLAPCQLLRFPLLCLPICKAMSQSRQASGVRAEKAADAETLNLMRGFSSDRTNLVEENIQFMAEKYRANHCLSCVLTAMIKKPEIETMLGGSLDAPTNPKDLKRHGEGGWVKAQTAKPQKLRACIKKWKHLDAVDQLPTVFELLKALQPNMFTNLDEWGETSKKYIPGALRFAVDVEGDDFMPSPSFPHSWIRMVSKTLIQYIHQIEK